MTVIPVYVLSAVLSNSSDEVLCAHQSVMNLPTNAPRPGNTMKADYSTQ